MTVSAERDLLSIGMLASHVQRSVRAIEQAATALNLEPAMKINGTTYWDATQVEKLTDAIRNRKGNR
jgi:hypothetical protein